MAIGRASQLRIYQSGSTAQAVARFQNYFHGVVSDGYRFLPFELGGLEMDESGGQDTLSLVLPDIQETAQITEAGLKLGYMVEVKVLEFSQTAPLADLPGDEVQIGGWIGMILGASRDLREITWSVGSPLASTVASAPGLLFTNRLVGTPCRV